MRCEKCGFTYGLQGNPFRCMHCGCVYNETGQEENTMSPSIPWDSVKVEYSLEDTIDSASVRVFVRAMLLVDSAGSETSDEMFRSALRAVLDENWSISQVERTEDPTGLERVVKVATVRIDQKQSAGLITELRRANRSGLKLELMRMMHRPPATDVAAAMKELRQKAYNRANEEADLLNSVFADPDRTWTVGKIMIEEERLKTSDEPVCDSAAYLTSPSIRHQVDNNSESFTSNVVALKATVILHRPSVVPPKGGFFLASG